MVSYTLIEPGAAIIFIVEILMKMKDTPFVNVVNDESVNSDIIYANGTSTNLAIFLTWL